MPIKLTGDTKPASKSININGSIEHSLRAVGDLALKVAVQGHGFNNQTFNLQDSYGYAIYYLGSMVGNPVMSDKQASKPRKVKGVNVYGHDESINFLQSYRPDPIGWSLVFVAGMYYASIVELYYHLDVLQNSEMEAEMMADKLFNNISWKNLGTNKDEFIK